MPKENYREVVDFWKTRYSQMVELPMMLVCEGRSPFHNDTSREMMALMPLFLSKYVIDRGLKKLQIMGIGTSVDPEFLQGASYVSGQMPGLELEMTCVDPGFSVSWVRYTAFHRIISAFPGQGMTGMGQSTDKSPAQNQVFSFQISFHKKQPRCISSSRR